MSRLWRQILLMRRFDGLVSMQRLTLDLVQPSSGWNPYTGSAVQCGAFSLTSGFTETRVYPLGWPVAPARHKSSRDLKKGSKNKKWEAREEDEDTEPEASDDEDKPEEDPNLPRTYKDQEQVVPSLRYDVIIRAGLDVPRNKVDDAFYSSRLRLNGQPLIKKSKTVSVGDTLDLVLEDNVDTGMVTLMRVIFKVMAGTTETTEKHKVMLRRWKHLVLPKAEVYKQ